LHVGDAEGTVLCRLKI